MKTEKLSIQSEKILFRVCHSCQFVCESHKELKNCPKCTKAFLPLNYLAKIHQQIKFEDLFAESHELSSEDVIKGLYVIW